MPSAQCDAYRATPPNSARSQGQLVLLKFLVMLTMASATSALTAT